MYLPKIFQSDDYTLLKEIVHENAFASIITYKDKILSTKAMIQLCAVKNEKFVLETHISKANPIAKVIEKGDEVLCDFLGAHAYISSSWYDHINVSTWNYEEVQIYGVVEFMSNDELFKHLKNLTANYEAEQKCPMTAEKMGTEYVHKEMQGALGIKITPTEIKIKQKLSQNRDDSNYQKIIDSLNDSDIPLDKIIAQKMKKLRNL